MKETAINKAIGLACEKGYRWSIDVNLEKMLLDPKFWQALGEGLGWRVLVDYDELARVKGGEATAMIKAIPQQNFFQADRYDTDNYHMLHLWKDGKSYDLRVLKEVREKITPLWKYYWHNFIDHLAQGRPDEDFFKEILSSIF